MSSLTDSHVPKETFLAEGIKEHEPTEAADCSICHDPLITSESHKRLESEAHAHAAVKIQECGHVFGQACLTAWLNSANTCPMCRAALFAETAETAEIRGEDYVRLIMDVRRIQEQLRSGVVEMSLEEVEAARNEQMRQIDLLIGRLPFTVDGMSSVDEGED
ncbi:hypothetical protein P280DRAFT_506028 [Massarina eburnea CBS 473.64]|uniref:RING-type domain-containing protein n=1 Tax=Massarina eburnea CBS 473.64 TaxID=1395130 RepID=A0A6A6S8B5_9PLEO|nr:hypothetical protein P280DRAFT_506028 [Massarina eburnea CBS 473.64]